MGSNLGVTIVGTEDPRPLRPGVVATTASRRLGKQLEVHDRLGAVTHGSSNTVVTSVATSDDDDILALCADVGAVSEFGIEEGLGVELEELHSEVDAVDIAVGNLEVSRPCSASSKDYGVVLSAQLVSIDVHTDVGIGDEGL